MNLLIILFNYLRTLIETKLLPKIISKFIIERRKKRYIAWLTKNSSFYKDFSSKSKLTDLPISNKAILMDHFDSINTKGLKKEDCFTLALKAEEDRNFSPMLGDISVGLSSGTSGSRGFFCASAPERALWAGIIMAKVLPKFILKKQSIALFLRANNNLYDRLNSKKISFNFFDMLTPINQHIDELNKLNPNILVAPASVLCMLAKLVEQNTLNLTPIKIISAAEVLDSNDQLYLEKIFKQKIHQIYQCTEGFLATTCKEGNLHINEESIVIEKEYIDKKNGRFVPIITDLLRFTQPIVRYRLNDILVEDLEECPCGSHHLSLKRIEGREDDIFYFKHKTNSEEVSIFPDFIRRSIIKSHSKIEEYKVTQTAIDLLEVEIKAESKNLEEIKMNITKEFNNLFFKMEINPPKVNFIPYKTLSLTQKRKRVHRSF